MSRKNQYRGSKVWSKWSFFEVLSHLVNPDIVGCIRIQDAPTTWFWSIPKSTSIQCRKSNANRWINKTTYVSASLQPSKKNKGDQKLTFSCFPNRNENTKQWKQNPPMEPKTVQNRVRLINNEPFHVFRTIMKKKRSKTAHQRTQQSANNCLFHSQKCLQWPLRAARQHKEHTTTNLSA
jgi:hypothetical protein